MEHQPHNPRTHLVWFVVAGLLLIAMLASSALGSYHWQHNPRNILVKDTSTQHKPKAPEASRGNGSSTNRHEVDVQTPDLASNASRITPDYTIPPVVDGIAPVLSRIPTEQPVVFLGIDDGAFKDTFEVELMRTHNIKASLFLADSFMGQNRMFFKQFLNIGSLIENHSVSHTLMSDLSYEQQVDEICGQADIEQKHFGRRPVLFRPPGGDYNYDTQRAAATCGMKAVVLWIAKANGGSMQYQVGTSLQPGDIVLMHFRPGFKDDMQAFLNAQNKAGLHTELLTDWLPQE